MSSSLPAWRSTYKSILTENGAATPAMQCMAFAMACQQHSLTLTEFVAERKALLVPPSEVFAPTVMATISDWDGSWETLNRLLHLEDSHVDRVIAHYAKTNQPLTNEAYTMFKSVVEEWTQPLHRVQWYRALTSEQSEQTILEALATGQRHNSHLAIQKKEAVEHAIYNIQSNASPDFWKKVLPHFLDRFAPSLKESQRIARHILQHAPATLQKQFVTNFQTRWENVYAGLNVDDFAQWIADVIQHQPAHATIVLDGVMKKNATILQSPVVSSNMVVIDYFLNHGLQKVSGSQQVRNVLNALVNGKGNDALRERAWIKKLDMFGAKPSDLKQMETWTPSMAHAFDYWLATSFQNHSGQAPAAVYTHINREVGWEYERRFGIDLRNPEGFQKWRETRTAGADPFAALAANATLCDTWEEGCSLYAINAAHPPLALSGLNFELFSSTNDALHA